MNTINLNLTPDEIDWLNYLLGVGYYNTSLTPDKRMIIEELYKKVIETTGKREKREYDDLRGK